MVVLCTHYKLSIQSRHKDDWTDLVWRSACMNHHYQRWTTFQLNLMHCEQNLAFFSTAYGKTFSLDTCKNDSNIGTSCLPNILEIMVKRRNYQHLYWGSDKSLKLLINVTTVCQGQWMGRAEKEVVNASLMACIHSLTELNKFTYLQLPCVQQFVLLCNCHWNIHYMF